jgi:hypothetical protein
VAEIVLGVVVAGGVSLMSLSLVGATSPFSVGETNPAAVRPEGDCANRLVLAG